MTKKTVVAAGVIVALGVVWTGASWFTGKQVEKHIGEFTDNINSQLKTNYPNAGLKVSYRDYQRGLFSSHLTYVLQSDGTASDHQVLDKNQEVVFKETLYHGPFPLSQLKHLNLIPSMASVYSELVKTDAVAPLFELTKDVPFINAETRVTYSGDTHSDIRLAAIDFQNPEQKLNFSGSDLKLFVARDLSQAHISGNIANLATEKKNQLGQNEVLTLQDLALDSTSRKSKFDINVGDANITLKKLTLNVENENGLTINDVNVSSENNADDVNLSGKLGIDVASVVLRDQNLGAVNLKASFAGVDGHGLKQFSDAYRAKFQALMSSPEPITTDEYQQQMAMVVLHNLPQLLKGNPQIHIAPITWKNAKGQSDFNLALDLTDPLQKDHNAITGVSDEEALIRQSIKNVDLKLNLPLNMLTELFVQTGPKVENDNDKKQIEAMARQQAQLIAGVGQMSQLTVTKDNAITSSLQYADGTVTFNGRKLTLAEFIAPYISVPAQDAPQAVPAPAPQAQ